MRQGESCGGADVLLEHVGAAVPRGVRGRGPSGDDVGTHAVDLERRADLGDLGEGPLAQLDLGDELLRDLDAVGELGLVVGEAGSESGGVGLVGQPALDHLDPQRGITWGRHLDGESEPIEQLWSELSFLGVHGSDQHELGGVLDRDAVTLHRREPHGGGVEQQVDEVVVEQVDLVDVEDAAVRPRQQPGLVRGDALAERLLQVQRTENPVLGGADRQLDEADRPALGGRIGGERAVGGERVGLVRIGREPVAGDDLDGRQH